MNPALSLPTLYQEFIHQSRYARFLKDKRRRESWGESVDRLMEFFRNHLFLKHNYTIPQDVHERVRNHILKLGVMPSMRVMMTAGKALMEHNVAAYNCSYLPVNSVEAFSETVYILMCGTGVGFSVERQNVNQLPQVPDHLHRNPAAIIKVKDSKIGWAEAVRELLGYLYAGVIPKWDTSEVRPAGAVLETFGGRASGPEPLEDLLKYIVAKFQGAVGRRLTSLECHDIMCMIGVVVVVGGVRRSAMISLSNLSDDRMRTAKTGQWWDEPANNIIREGQRALANNSIAFTEKPETGVFMKEWLALYESRSGERGIFNREAAIKQAAKNGRRIIGYGDSGPIFSYTQGPVTFIGFGTNPCSEIILRPFQFCNLSEAVARQGDTLSDLAEKVAVAAIIGTWQSTITDFKYLRPIWQMNTEEERLLGVSLTGIMDCDLTNGTQEGLEETLEHLKAVAVETNKILAAELGIPQSAAVTCVKPSGTVSQLVNSSEGIHARHSEYYVRTVRADNKDPLTHFMKDRGFPNEPCSQKPGSVTIFSFPVKAPHGCITKGDRTAIQQLEFWLKYQDHWCEHKPSVTINVKEHEWVSTGAWVWEHFDKISGISFLPHTDHVYAQAPYQECDEAEYLELLSKMPKEVNWEELKDYEGGEDNTVGAQTLACSAGACEIVDVGTV